MSITDEQIIIDVKIGACKTDSFDEASDSNDENKKKDKNKPKTHTKTR